MQKSANLPLSFIKTQQVCVLVGPYYTFHWQDEDFLSGPPNYKGWFEGYDFGFKVNVRIGLRVKVRVRVRNSDGSN